MNLIETDDKITKHIEVNYKEIGMDNFFVTEVEVQGEKESYTLKVDKFGTRYIFCTNGTMLKIDNNSDINLIVYNMLLPYLKNE